MFHVQKNTDISGIKEENIQYMRCRTSEMWKMWCLMPFRQAWYGAASVQGDQGSVNQQCYHAGLGLFHSCNSNLTQACTLWQNILVKEQEGQILLFMDWPTAITRCDPY